MIRGGHYINPGQTKLLFAWVQFNPLCLNKLRAKSICQDYSKWIQKQTNVSSAGAWISCEKYLPFCRTSLEFEAQLANGLGKTYVPVHEATQKHRTGWRAPQERNWAVTTAILHQHIICRMPIPIWICSMWATGLLEMNPKTSKTSYIINFKNVTNPWYQIFTISAYEPLLSCSICQGEALSAIISHHHQTINDHQRTIIPPWSNLVNACHSPKSTLINPATGAPWLQTSDRTHQPGWQAEPQVWYQGMVRDGEW